MFRNRDLFARWIVLKTKSKEIWTSLPERLALRKGSRLGEAETTVVIPWLREEERNAFLVLVDDVTIAEHVLFLDGPSDERDDERARLRELLRLTRRRIVSFFRSGEDFALECAEAADPTAAMLAAAATVLAHLREAGKLEVLAPPGLVWSKIIVERAGLRYRTELVARE